MQSYSHPLANIRMCTFATTTEMSVALHKRKVLCVSYIIGGYEGKHSATRSDIKLNANWKVNPGLVVVDREFRP